MPPRGAFICFEGGEGSGKSTHARKLASELERRGLPIVRSREPGGTPLGEELRELLLHHQHELLPLEEFLLFSTARAELANSIVRPALDAGRTVILDRYYYSSLAYQGAGGLSLELMRQVTTTVVKDCVPDLVLLLEVPPEVGMERSARIKGGGSDRFERREAAFHQEVRRLYLQFAQEEPERFRVIETTPPHEEVFARILEAVLDLLMRRGLLTV
jgi:dTMP kinase